VLEDLEDQRGLLVDLEKWDHRVYLALKVNLDPLDPLDLQVHQEKVSRWLQHLLENQCR